MRVSIAVPGLGRAGALGETEGEEGGCFRLHFRAQGPGRSDGSPLLATEEKTGVAWEEMEEKGRFRSHFRARGPERSDGRPLRATGECAGRTWAEESEEEGEEEGRGCLGTGLNGLFKFRSTCTVAQNANETAFTFRNFRRSYENERKFRTNET